MQTIEELSASLKQKISDQPIEKIKLEETVSYSKHPFRVPKNTALKALAKDIKEHGLLERKSSIFRYIRLNYLIDDILELIDKGMIRLTLAVDLSYFSKQRQAVIYKYFFADKKAALNADAIKRMKECSKPDFNEEAIDSIMAELREPKKKGSPMMRFKKRYEGNFKNEEEFCALMENLLLEYYERKNIPYKTKEVN